MLIKKDSYYLLDISSFSQWLLAKDNNQFEYISATLPITISILYCMLQTIDALTYNNPFHWLHDGVKSINNSTISHMGNFTYYNPDSQGRWILVISN